MGLKARFASLFVLATFVLITACTSQSTGSSSTNADSTSQNNKKDDSQDRQSPNPQSAKINSPSHKNSKSVDSKIFISIVNNVYHFSSGEGNGPALQLNSNPVSPGDFGQWIPVAAVTTSTGYDVAWVYPGQDNFAVWSMDQDGNYVGAIYGPGPGGNPVLMILESTLQYDINGDGSIGIPAAAAIPSPIQTNFGTTLATINYVYYVLDSTGNGPALKYNSTSIMVDSFGNWIPIGAIKTSSGYDVAWAFPGQDNFTVWSMDGNGNYVQALYGPGPGSSSVLSNFELMFNQDLNGDGYVGPRPAPPANALLFDDFVGAVGPVLGRQPVVGPTWSAVEIPGASITAGNGGMTVSPNGGPAAFAENTLSQRPGEIGVKFKLTGALWEGINLGGTVTSTQVVVLQVNPSGGDNLIIQFPVPSGVNNLNDLATQLAAYVNSYFASYDATNPSGPTKIKAQANGSTVQLSSPLGVPYVNSGVWDVNGNPVTITTDFVHATGGPVVASYPSGTNFKYGMLHFFSGLDGWFALTFYYDGLVMFDQTKQMRPTGLVEGEEYTFKVCIGAPGSPDAGYVWAAMYKSDGTIVNAAVVYTDPNDSKWAWYGYSVFYEGGGAGSDMFKYTQAYALPSPSISRASIQSLVGP